MKIKRNIQIGTLILIVGLFCAIFGALNNGVKSIAFIGIKPVVPEKERQLSNSITNQKFNSIEIDVKRAKVKIAYGKHFKVEYAGRRSNLPAVKIENNHLIISQTNNVLTSTENTIHWKEARRVERDNTVIKITVPENTKLQKIKVFNNYGNTSILGVNSAMLEITEMEGAVVLKNLSTNAIDLEANSGKDIYLQNVDLEDGQIQNKNTNLNVNGGTIKNIAIDSDHGSVGLENLTLDGGMTHTHFGNTTLSKVELVNGYLIDTKNGNNTVQKTQVENYTLTAKNGNNQAFGKQRKSRFSNQDVHNINTLSLTVTNGNNVIK